MTRTTDAIRALAARAGARKSGTRRRSAGAAVTALVTAVTLSLSSAGGTTALWTGSVSVQAPSIRSGSITALLEGFTDLSHTFTSSALTKTSYIRVGNTGETNANFTVSLGLAPGSSASLAGTTTATFWYAASPAACTETAAPYYGATYAWNAVPVFSGSLPAGASGIYCIRSRTAASNLTSSASITPQITVALSVPGTGWTSSATASATESTAPDAAIIGSDYTDAVRSDGAINYWRLGESSGTILHDVIGTSDAYANAGLTRGADGALGGDANTATTFDGANAAITRNLVTGPQTFAIEAWFKTTSTAGGKIVGFGDSMTGLSGSYDRHIFLDTSGRVNFGVWIGYGSTITTAGAYNDGQWHHVVGNLSGAGQELYVDGVKIGSLGTTTAQGYNGYWHIGGDSPWAGDAYFAGAVDEVAVYGAPLSARAVGNHFNLSGRGAYPAGTADPYGSTVYGDSPSIFWRLGESSGSTAADSSSSGANTGAYTGTITKGVPGAVPGTRNTAASFGGSDGLVYSTKAYTNPQDYSLELWFNTTTTTGGKLLGYGGSPTGLSSQYDRHLYLQNDGKLVFGSWPGSSQVVVTPASYNNGQWHHVVATQSSTAGMMLYVDGQLIGTNPAVNPLNYGGYWRVGGDNLNGWPGTPSSFYVSAKIDEVAIYGSVLSSTQVKRHYSVATGAPAASFTAVTTGRTTDVNAGASSDYDGGISSYSWNWGDSTPAGSGATASHTYAAPGTYTVTLTVTDTSGRTDTTTTTVTAADTVAPSTPGTPTIASNTGTTVGLTWPASTDDVAVSGYEVYRNGSLAATVAGNSWTDTGRALNTAYTYDIRAKDSSGNFSAHSASVSVTTHSVNTAVWFQVKTGSGLCVGSAGTSNFDPLQQLDCAASPLQNFQFTATTDGYFTVPSRAAPNSVWDVNGGGSAAGTGIIVYGLHGGTNQQWLPQQIGNGVYTFTSRGSHLCLAVPGGSTTSGTQLTQEACDGSASQQFTLVVAE